MPINRFLDYLVASGNAERYLEALSGAFNVGAVAGLMCRDTLSVGWDGRLYDCDFNQMLDLPIEREGARTVFEVAEAALGGRPVRVARHCLGCTAGQGSSCAGATSS
jgi:hypothetical protein